MAFFVPFISLLWDQIHIKTAEQEHDKFSRDFSWTKYSKI